MIYLKSFRNSLTKIQHNTGTLQLLVTSFLAIPCGTFFTPPLWLQKTPPDVAVAPAAYASPVKSDPTGV